MEISELYNKYSNLLVLHGIGKTGALDNMERTLEERYRYSRRYANKIQYSCHVMWHQNPFTNWGCTGLILVDGKIIHAFISDGGTQRDQHYTQMNDAQIIEVMDNITPAVLSEQYIELLVENPVFEGVYFVRDSYALDCTDYEVYYNAHLSGYCKLFEIYKNEGQIKEINCFTGKSSELSNLSSFCL